MDRQVALSKSLYAIQSTTLKELVSLQRESWEKYFEANRAWGERFVSVNSIGQLLELQRAYGDKLMSNATEAAATCDEIVRGAFDESTEAFRRAWTAGDEDISTSQSNARVKKPAADNR